MLDKGFDNLRAQFIKVMQEYASVYETVSSQKDWKNPFGKIITKEIPELLRDCANIHYPILVSGSYGKGRWTMVPWVSVYDKRITNSAQKGIYIVYLFNKDEKTLYLTLNQGATGVLQGTGSNQSAKLVFTGVAGSSSAKNQKALRDRAAAIRKQLDCKSFECGNEINTGADNYDAGAICYKKYNVENLPSGKGIVEDLQKMMKIYDQYRSAMNEGTEKNSWLLTWNPMYYDFSEYEAKRRELLSGNQCIEQWACANTNVLLGDRVYLMRIGVGNKNGIIASGHAVRTSYLAPHYNEEKAAKGEQIKKIDVEFDCMLDRNGRAFLEQKALNQMFPNQQWSPQGSGIEIKKEYTDLLEQEWQKHINAEKEERNDVQISGKEAIERIKAYIANKGFTYPEGLIENYYLSLKSKPFVILAGTSGTGKTRLVKLFAEAINAECKTIAVRPDWSDSSDLFGHVDLNGKFNAGEILDFLLSAKKKPNKPHILCLDEMNLARVEYYLSDFLSVIETRDLLGEEIHSDPLISSRKYDSDSNAREKYGEMDFPQNLYLIGTVNMDETTFPFSKKVLDRANTIEFNYVDLVPKHSEYEKVEKLSLSNCFLKTKYLFLAQCDEDEFVTEVSIELQKINSILKIANFHVGYRVRDEIVFYMLNNKETALLTRDEAFDNEIMQKILPRIQGSSASIKDMLCELFKEFAGDFDGYQTQSNDTASKMMKKLQNQDARYPKSAEKTAFMVRRFEEDGFTSYWL